VRFSCLLSHLTRTLDRFVKGSRPGRQTGFDFDEEDLLELDQYHDIIVASAIFGTIYDLFQFTYDFVLCFLFLIASSHLCQETMM